MSKKCQTANVLIFLCWKCIIHNGNDHCEWLNSLYLMHVIIIDCLHLTVILLLIENQLKT